MAAFTTHCIASSIITHLFHLDISSLDSFNDIFFWYDFSYIIFDIGLSLNLNTILSFKSYPSLCRQQSHCSRFVPHWTFVNVKYLIGITYLSSVCIKSYWKIWKTILHKHHQSFFLWEETNFDIIYLL